MIELYFKLVMAGRRTCDETNSTVTKVPAHLMSDVTALLSERGYDKNGKKIN